MPYTRGPEFSRPVNEIVKEAEDLVANGSREVILLGQNVNAYQNDGKKLSNLISEISKIKKINRIRYTTSHPIDFSDDLIESHKNISKLMPMIHLPVQSGSNKILKNMNRKHTREEYHKTVKNLINARPDIKFSSDFIIGYPGETEKDFNETISLINEIKFINSYSFMYNQRPGTPASKLKSIDKETQHKRLVILQKLLADIQKEENRNQIGNLKKVLIENQMKNQEAYFGRIENFTPVITKNVLHSDIGKIIYVRIKDSNSNNLFGIKENIERGFAA